MEMIAETLEDRTLDKFLVIRIAATQKAQLRRLAKCRKSTIGIVVRTFIAEGLKKEAL